MFLLHTHNHNHNHNQILGQGQQIYLSEFFPAETGPATVHQHVISQNGQSYIHADITLQGISQQFTVFYDYEDDGSVQMQLAQGHLQTIPGLIVAATTVSEQTNRSTQSDTHSIFTPKAPPGDPDPGNPAPNGGAMYFYINQNSRR